MQNRKPVLVLLATLAFTANVFGGSDSKAECGAAGVLKLFRVQLPRLEAGPNVPQVRVASGSPVDLVFVLSQQDSPSRNEARRARLTTPAPKLEMSIVGLYRGAGTARLELWSLAVSGSEARKLQDVAIALEKAPKESPELARAWAEAYAKDLAGAVIAAGSRGGDLGFHLHTIERLKARFGADLGILGSLGEGEEWTGRTRPSVDLFSVTTGAAAIEESLQLELLRGTPQDSGEPVVPLAELKEPTVRSHPFEEMLRGREPKLFDIARVVPHDQWYAHLSAISAGTRLSDLLDQWGTSFLQAVDVSSRDRKLKEKLLGQLALDLSVLTRLFGDLVLGDVALTGNDLYLQDGSDLALILRVRNRGVLETMLARQRDEAKKQRPDARESRTEHSGVVIRSLTTPDRRVSTHVCDLGDLQVHATSLAALHRIIDANSGKAPRMADAKDFLYMRTIFPGDAAQEDAFLYLSDPFIRRVVGAEQKIGRLRQARCAANLRAIGFAGLEALLEGGGDVAVKLDALLAHGLLDAQRLRCPSGGQYTLDAGPQRVETQGIEAVCSVHNRLGRATPLVEIPAAKTTEEEARGYRQFVENYSRYWTQFFDPIGIRFKLDSNGGVEAETCILPLIENSIYDSVRQVVGGAPVELSGPVGPHALGGFSIKLPREGPMVEHFWRELPRMGREFLGDEIEALVDQIGDSASLALHDGDLLFTFDERQLFAIFGGARNMGSELLFVAPLLSAITLPVSVSIDVKDPAVARPLLERVLSRTESAMSAQRRPRGFFDDGFALRHSAVDPYRGVELGFVSLRFFFLDFRLHYAFLGKKLVVTTQRHVLTEMIDVMEGTTELAGNPEVGNLLLEVRPSAFERARAQIALSWQERMRDACFSNFPALDLLQRSGVADATRLAPESVRRLGYVPFCPASGVYAIDERSGSLSCSIHRHPHAPRLPLAVPADAPFVQFLESLDAVRATFRFTDEGVRTRVAIRRKKAP